MQVIGGKSLCLELIRTACPRYWDLETATLKVGLRTTLTPTVRLIPINHDLPCRAHFAVKLQRIVLHLHVEGLFVAVEFEVIWYSPRVPAGAVSPKGHRTLGNLFAVSARDDHIRIE